MFGSIHFNDGMVGTPYPFSKLKLIKTYLRSTMSQDRLRGLAILSIENRRARKVDLDGVVTDFAHRCARRSAHIYAHPKF